MYDDEEKVTEWGFLLATSKPALLIVASVPWTVIGEAHVSQEL